jgi:hypothetical protein
MEVCHGCVGHESCSQEIENLMRVMTMIHWRIWNQNHESATLMTSNVTNILESKLMECNSMTSNIEVSCITPHNHVITYKSDKFLLSGIKFMSKLLLRVLTLCLYIAHSYRQELLTEWITYMGP